MIYDKLDLWVIFIFKKSGYTCIPQNAFVLISICFHFQFEIFNGKVEPYVKRALEGYNVAVLAFGAVSISELQACNISGEWRTWLQ